MKGKVVPLICPGGQGQVYISPGGGTRRLFICLWGRDDMLAEIAAPLEKRVGEDMTPFALAQAYVEDWDGTYTPWPSAEMPGRMFAGGGEAHYRYLVDSFLPAAKGLVPDAVNAGIMGYSLGGLFALWAALKDDSPFHMAASVSGALWYEGFEAWALAHTPGRLGRAYISLGLKEAKTGRGPMRRNQAASQAIYEGLQTALGSENAAFQWNNGNHFFEIPQRIGRAITFLCACKSE